MSSSFLRSIELLNQSSALSALASSQRGLEKESLRVGTDGAIAHTPHPSSYGSALTNPYITTDFSEALLEFITPVSDSMESLLQCLEEIHQYAYHGLGDELLWSSSMPCVLPEDSSIPIAHYGTSNIATMKSTYREGLGQRYGRAMQTISGVHYNFSFSDTFWEQYQHLLGSTLSMQDFKTEQYFHLIRNFRRHSWLLVYLFGASPALCQTFLGHDLHNLDRLGAGTLYAKHGTSLRMGDLGYQSSAQQSLYVCYNSLEEYAQTLGEALTTSIPEYEAIGTHQNGKRIQLSTALLQIENEFYSSIRPKRVTHSGEAPLHALNKRGVEYIEVRCLDVNPYLPLGLNAHQLHFIDAFLLFCLLDDSPAITPEECSAIQSDSSTVVNSGRAFDARIQHRGTDLPVADAAKSLLADIEHCAKSFDLAGKGSVFTDALAEQTRKVEEPALLPSAKVLADLEQHDNSYYRFAMHCSKQHAQWFAERPLSDERMSHFKEAARQSIEQQTNIEASDTEDFERFLADYYSRQ